MASIKTETELKKMKVNELRAELDQAGLDNKGKKDELVERLQQYYQEEEEKLLLGVEDDAPSANAAAPAPAPKKTPAAAPAKTEDGIEGKAATKQETQAKKSERAARFGTADKNGQVAEVEALRARAEKFGNTELLEQIKAQEQILERRKRFEADKIGMSASLF
ncbi:uncharacterized protein MONBRDRAFT_4720 [Monosiga brevicollis MX1]|uniref:SAP domain-containing protein n=1 Tax=Monosiga brevicollis TaxID=81824 RepID=A9UNQ6_MONBE|nr:uncharacterized protein MONBRDRAFT_4720 [Monosiga brevicollis MX1]EDQ92741.1 predicted protein [Monosiga brevicollis MX1]|eukprot:XP_001742503.1 hypothetical protein [Monosiga brevicollis MX1]